MIKTWVLLFFILYTAAWAKPYQIPSALLKEVCACEEGVKNHPNAAESHFELAMSLAYTGQIERGWAELKTIPQYDDHYAPKVLEKYTKLSQSDPKEWKHFFKLAFGYYFNDQKDKAIECFEHVLTLDPKNIWAMGFIGLLEGERGNIDKGIAWSQRALDIEPNATAIHFLIAEGYRRKGDYFKALKHILTVGRLKSEEKMAK